MEHLTIRDLKKGDFFTRKQIENPKENQVWVRGEYDRSAKAYACTRFSDISDEIFLKPNKEVYIEFVF